MEGLISIEVETDRPANDMYLSPAVESGSCDVEYNLSHKKVGWGGVSAR